MTEKPSILVVDDDEQVLNALGRVLRKNFEVELCSSAAAAFEQLNSKDFQIILCDQNLGDGQGLAIFRKIRDSHPHIVRVLLSGQIDTTEISAALKEQLVHRFFVKPWDNEVLRLQLLECAQLYDLMLASLTDPVTQLSNRRHFDEKLLIEVERCKRHQRSLSLILVDVDRFKNINDDEGHTAGDVALKKIADALIQSVRNIDNVARIGGDEFAVILPETKLADAFTIAERMRALVEKTNLSGPKGSFAVSVCLGIAALPDHGADAATLYNKADQAMLEAKKQGRNKTVIAPT